MRENVAPSTLRLALTLGMLFGGGFTRWVVIRFVEEDRSLEIAIFMILVGLLMLVTVIPISAQREEVRVAPSSPPRQRKQRVQKEEERKKVILSPEECELLEKEWQRMLVINRSINNRQNEVRPLPPPQPVAGDREAAQDATACVVCLDNKKTSCAVPCGHLILCNSCSREADFETCPICRAPCEKIIRVYD